MPLSSIEAEPLPALQPVGIRFDEAGAPGIVSLPVRLEFLQLENRLSSGVVAALPENWNLRHNR